MSINHLLVFISKYSLQILLLWLAAYLTVKLLGSRPFLKGFLILSGIGYVFTVLYMTLLSRWPQGQIHYQLELLWEYRQAFQFEGGKLKIQNIEFAWYIRDNILLFVPLGVLLSEFLYKTRKNVFLWVLSACCLASIAVELSQLGFRVGMFELDDILNNTIGAVLGFAFFTLAKRLKESTQGRKRS